MKHFLHILGLVVLGLSLSCVGGNQAKFPQYHTNAAAKEGLTLKEVIPVWVDAKFTQEQKETLGQVMTEWNYVLNGPVELKVIKWDADLSADSDESKEVAKTIDKTHQGLAIVAMTDDDPRLEDMDADGVLAFVDALGDEASHMVVLTEHFGTLPMHGVILHEFGHALGAQHTMVPSLMFPYAGLVPYVGHMQADCVDYVTADQVATYHHLDLNHMNYCQFSAE